MPHEICMRIFPTIPSLKADRFNQNYSATGNEGHSTAAISDRIQQIPIIQSTHSTGSLNDIDEQRTYDVELLICIESNRKHLDFRKLWTVRGK